MIGLDEPDEAHLVCPKCGSEQVVVDKDGGAHCLKCGYDGTDKA